MKSIALGFAPTTSRKPLVNRVLACIFRFFELRRQRRDLLKLSPELLRDIGLCDAEVRAELRRPIWDAPVQFTLR